MPRRIDPPGVFVDQIRVGVRTIAGVATSITAFIGRAARGPVDEPVLINGWEEYERLFGGLWLDSTMSFAVRDFYENGGVQALIVRLHNGGAAASVALSNLTLEAASVGEWGHGLEVAVDHDTREPADVDRFNLVIGDGKGEAEKFPNLSVSVGDPRFVAKVLRRRSSLVRVALDDHRDPVVPDTRPDSESVAATAGTGSDGVALTAAQITTGSDLRNGKEGLFALDKADLFSVLCLPPYLASGDVDAGVLADAAAYCEQRRAMLLVDPPAAWIDKDAAVGDGVTTGVVAVGTSSPNAAVYFPRLRRPNPLRNGSVESFVPCGAVAGVIARTDARRGVWKAPAGMEAGLVGVTGLSVSLSDAENGELNPLGLNCLREFPQTGPVIWGARTLQGNDQFGSQWKYLPVRRLALYLEETLYRGTKWAVFEPNDALLWAGLRSSIEEFLEELFRQGAFQGTRPSESYFVKCDSDTTTPTDIAQGIINIQVGFAPLKPAEFIILTIRLTVSPT